MERGRRGVGDVQAQAQAGFLLLSARERDAVPGQEVVDQGGGEDRGTVLLGIERLDEAARPFVAEVGTVRELLPLEAQARLVAIGHVQLAV